MTNKSNANTTKGAVNAIKGFQGFQKIAKDEASDANLSSVGAEIGESPRFAYPERQTLEQYRKAFAQSMLEDYPEVLEEHIDNLFADQTLVVYFEAVNQRARDDMPLTEDMLKDLSEPNRRYLEQNYAHLIGPDQDDLPADWLTSGPVPGFGGLDEEDPNIVHDLRASIDMRGLSREYDIATVGDVYFGKITERQSSALNRSLAPSVEEFNRQYQKASRDAKNDDVDDYTYLMQGREEMKAFCDMYDRHADEVDFGEESDNRRLYYPLFIARTGVDTGWNDGAEYLDGVVTAAEQIRARRAARA